MLDLIIGSALPWILGIVAFFGSVGVAYFKGGKSEKNKQIVRRMEGMKSAQKTEKEIDNADRDTVIDINSK